jgi:hypothetical protein
MLNEVIKGISMALNTPLGMNMKSAKMMLNRAW